MEAAEKNVRSVLVRRWKESVRDLIPGLVEKALCSDTLQSKLLNQLEKQMLLRLRACADPRRPPRVQRDQEDMALALIRSLRRALEWQQISRPALQGLLRNLLTRAILRDDENLKAAEQRFTQRHEGQNPPLFLVISPTKACNLRCLGCYASAASGPGQELLEWDLFDRVLSEAKTLWGLRFFTLSGGEPLLYRSGGKGLLERRGVSVHRLEREGDALCLRALCRREHPRDLCPRGDPGRYLRGSLLSGHPGMAVGLRPGEGAAGGLRKLADSLLAPGLL